MTRHAAIFQPLVLRRVTIPNRIMSTAHTSGASEDGKPKARYQAYQEEKARGGIGLTIIGGSTAVAEDSPGADMLHLDATTDDIIPHYQELARRVKRHGTVVFSQLAHMGRRANWDNDRWLPPVAPSALREPAHRSFPKEMEDWDIRRIVRGFAEAAGRIRQGGLDGIELSATHNHIFDQFWSPATNRRTDAYGGSFDNRLRFTIEVIEAIRARIGEDMALGLRMSGDEFVDGGLDRDDLLRIAGALSAHGGIDYLSVLGGSAETLPAHALIFPGMEMPSAPYLYLPSAIRRETGLPVFHAQRIADVATAARAIADGHIDMAAMTRPHLADPHIVTKLREGREDDIRPCVGANYCIDRLYSGGQALCLHNPATGRELSLPHVIPRAATRRRVTVVGAGPAGLEAARVAAARGHAVTLFEQGARCGGQVRLAARLPWRAPLETIVDWLEAQVLKRGVDLRLGVRADMRAILDTAPDLIVIATGGIANAAPPVAGAGLSVPAAAILAEPPTDPGPALVFDDNGGETALSCAETLARAGAQVTFVTADPAPGARLERTTRPTFLRRLYDLGVTFVPDSRLMRLDPADNAVEARLRNEYTGAETLHRVAMVAIDYGTLPCADLYFALRPLSRNRGEVDLAALVAGRPQALATNPGGSFQLFRIGDAVAGRNIHAAILDALRLMKDL